ncbi:ATP-grasp fold amidoligase family protein [Flavobacterium sp. H122]|uniref:ATP-grasp fold amidoligase family protein n=1 Tax=Flavobacterium sp. H122 TaxID=2529860 RepID=UPI0010AA536C|nr:ATP-grasp fold amidoligase family protein [Flavobacterium sp. H122]
MNLIKREFFKVYLEILKKYSKNDLLICQTEYLIKNRVALNLKNPQEIAEKIHWLKLYYYDEKFKQIADKYECRKYVEEKVGDHILVKNLGVYSKFDEIDFDALPNQFVLKGTHGSGYNLIVTNKESENFKEARYRFDKWLKQNYYYKFRERVYKDIEPRIICEQFLIDNELNELVEYKFYCSNGKPFNVVVKAKEEGKYKMAYYNMDWVKIAPDDSTKNYLNREIKKPANFEDMKVIASKLSEDFYFIRVDLYSVNGKIYFSELTFFPNGAMKRLMIEHMNKTMGEFVDISHLVS